MHKDMERAYLLLRQKRPEIVTTADLANALNIPYQNVRNWELRGISRKGLKLIQDLIGAKDLFLPVENDEQNNGIVSMQHYDLYSSAGPGAPAAEAGVSITEIKVLSEWALENFGSNADSKIKLLTNRGVSMYPTIKDGDILFVDITCTEYAGDGIYILSFDGNLFTKRLIKDYNGNFVIVSDNKKSGYKDKVIDAGDEGNVKICGKIKKVFSLEEPV